MIDNRFKDAPWYSAHPDILIGGSGGIGSNTVYCLSKSIPSRIFLVDGDNVDEHNVGTQFFRKEDIGKKKVHCIQDIMESFGSSGKVYAIPMMIDKTCYKPISISAFDNMKARRELFDIWKDREDRQIFIDGRLRATMYEVYIVTPGREEEYEKTLFEDDASDDDLCTFKQTAHFGMLIGARITQVLANFLTNRETKQDTTTIPFFITELGECMYIKVA